MLKTWGKAMVLETFAANGKQYDIRLWFSRGEYVIRVFHGDHPANGYSYFIALKPHPDLKILAGQDMVKELTMVAKGDVEQQRYEKLVEALKAIRQFGGD